MLMPLVLGVGVGLVLGLTGAGGGILAVPALVFGLGWGAAEAAPVALLAVAGAALLGAAQGMRAGLVRYKAAALMACAGVPVTALGVAAAHALPERVLLLLFVCAMVIVALRMVRRGGGAASAARRAVPCRINPATGQLHWTPAVAAILAAIGALSGFLTGLLGVGGGFVIVPSLRQVSDISVHGVVATSLAVIALVAGGSVLVAWWQGAALPLLVAAPFVAGAAAGMLAGRRIVHHLNPVAVERTFAALMFVVAAGMCAKAFGLFS